MDARADVRSPSRERLSDTPTRRQMGSVPEVLDRRVAPNCRGLRVASGPNQGES